MTIEEQVKFDIETAKTIKQIEDLENNTKKAIEQIELLTLDYNSKINEYVLNPSDTILNELFSLKNDINKRSEELEQILRNPNIISI